MHTVRKILFIVLAASIFISHPTTALADITTGSSTSLAVLPRASDYQLSLSQSVAGGPISQGTEVTYTVVYGALPSAAFTLDQTLTVNFSQSTLDSVTPVADFMIGSATDGYNGAQPVVDFINKTITWHISQLPSGTTDQIVTFKLRTNGNYTGLTRVPITITADFSNQYVATAQQSVTTLYGFHIPEPSTSSVTPTQIPTPLPSVTPPPQIVPPLSITDISFTKITPSETTIHIATSKKTRLSAFYGPSQNALFQITSDTTLSSVHDLQLTKLSPQTQYFIKVIATDATGANTASDIMSFKTASSPSPVHVDQQSVIVISGNNPLINTNPLLPYAQVLIPYNELYTVGLRVTKPENIKHIVALVENSHVLAANTFTSFVSTVWSTPMREQQPGVYIAQLSAPSVPSSYDVYAQIQDNNGNITQTKIAETIVYGPLRVITINGQGIEHARLFLSVYDTDKNSYEPILSSEFQENPLFTDKNGFAVIKNGRGKYKISVSQYGYKSKDVFVTIDKSHLFPPSIELTHNGFNLVDGTQYYLNTASDFSQNLIASFQNLSSAPRFFKLISILVLVSLVLITFLLFLIRTRLSIFVIPLFIKHHVQRSGFVHGQILDAVTHQPISQAVVAISNRDSHEILVTTTSSKNGVFYLNAQWANSDNIINILAHGYRTNKFAVNKDLFPATFSLHENLVGGPLHNPFIASCVTFLGMLFETLLLLSFIMEVFFIQTVGTLGIIFTFLSFGNLLLYFFYQKETR